jgi:hypothetical protein
MDRLDLAPIGAKQQHLAILLASGMSVADAASQLDVGKRTCFTWLADRRLRAYVDELRAGIREEALGRLTAGATRAADRLVALVDHRDPTISLRASIAVLDNIVKARSLVEFERRISELEERQGLAIVAFGVDDDLADADVDGPDDRMYGAN